MISWSSTWPRSYTDDLRRRLSLRGRFLPPDFMKRYCVGTVGLKLCSAPLSSSQEEKSRNGFRCRVLRLSPVCVVGSTASHDACACVRTYLEITSIHGVFPPCLLLPWFLVPFSCQLTHSTPTFFLSFTRYYSCRKFCVLSYVSISL